MASLILTRRTRPRAMISLVPLIDVMMILLVFFMVTSTYLDLDMIPAVRQQDETVAAEPSDAEAPGSLMIRMGADGVPVVRGRSLGGDALGIFLRQQIADEPLLQVIVLPSGGATTQALITVMDQATRAGATRLRVIRLEARP